MASPERTVPPDVEAYLGPVAIAQAVDAGWMHLTPLTWTARGLVHWRRGALRWSGPQLCGLPFPAIEHGGGAWWPGRKVNLKD